MSSSRPFSLQFTRSRGNYNRILISVSYTHLDVYKRQCEKRANFSCGIGEEKASPMLLEDKGSSIVFVEDKRSSNAVSYTHLDVYKRQ